MDLKIRLVDGTNIPVSVDDRGQFICDYLGTKLYNESFSKLTSTVKEMDKRHVAMQVPATMLRGGDWKYGREVPATFADIMITGLHASNHNLLIKNEKGKPEQLARYDSKDNVFVRLTAAEKDKYINLLAAVSKADKELADFRKSIKLPCDNSVDLVAYWNKVQAKGKEKGKEKTSKIVLK